MAAGLRTVHIAKVNGEVVVLEHPVYGDDVVDDLRTKVADVLKLDPQVISLVSHDMELDITKTLSEAVGDAAEELTITVIQQPCRIRPADYDAHIKRDEVGFLKVDEIQYERYTPLIYPDDLEQLRTDFRHGGEKGFPDPSHVRKNPCGVAHFPEPRDININMMPFYMGKMESIPEEYKHYWPMIEMCKIPEWEFGKVGYLTIQESMVPTGQSQRRGGVHIESPGHFNQPGIFSSQRYDWGCGRVIRDSSIVQGGFYLATNTCKSCRLWNVQIHDSENSAGELGDMEHMRDLLGEGTDMEADTLYWLTDATPHESLPMETETYRQIFRLVTSSLSAWYPEHCTSNPLAAPDPETTAIVHGSKFA